MEKGNNFKFVPQSLSNIINILKHTMIYMIKSTMESRRGEAGARRRTALGGGRHWEEARGGRRRTTRGRGWCGEDDGAGSRQAWGGGGPCVAVDPCVRRRRPRPSVRKRRHGEASTRGGGGARSRPLASKFRQFYGVSRALLKFC
jgi:hypothetical protein